MSGSASCHSMMAIAPTDRRILEMCVLLAGGSHHRSSTARESPFPSILNMFQVFVLGSIKLSRPACFGECICALFFSEKASRRALPNRPPLGSWGVLFSGSQEQQ